MRIVITGASGFLGGRITNFLKAKKFNVIGCSNRKIEGLKKVNWNSKKETENLLEATDVVVNCAGRDIHRSKLKTKAMNSNSYFPQKLMKVAERKNVKLFIFISSFHVYKKNLFRIDEKSPLNKDNNYSLSKIDGENKVQKLSKNTQVLIIRSCNLFGHPFYKNKNCWNLLFNNLVRTTLKKKTAYIKSNVDLYRNYSSIENFCYFIKKIINLKNNNKLNLPKIINYTTNNNLPISKVAINILKNLRKVYKNKKFDIVFKNKKIINSQKIIFSSKFQSRLNFNIDKYFNTEIKNLILYCKKNF
jgi:UDP-glucose 4-epimerase